MATDPPPCERADHCGYIKTVRFALLLKDIRVSTASFNAGWMRTAGMTLLQPDEDFDEPWHPTFTNARFVELRWHEQDGWSLLALYAAENALLPTTWRRGSAVVPPPEEICTWLAGLLATPAHPGNHADSAYRSHQQRELALEAALAAYAL